MQWLPSRRTWPWWILIVSVLFNIGFGTTFGVRTYQHRCGATECSRAASVQSLRQAMNLTPEQQAQFTAGKEKLLKQTEDLERQLAVERRSLANLLAAPEPDRTAIAARLDRISALQRQVQSAVVEHLLEEKQLLTPEQQRKFEGIIRSRICLHNSPSQEGLPGDRGACGGPHDLKVDVKGVHRGPASTPP